jgi:hypothetical protein
MNVIITVGVLVLLVAIAWFLIRLLRRRAGRMGYPRLMTYLRATPRNSAEKRDAVDLFAIGLALSLLGIIFPLFVVIGLVPLYYGCRKIGDVLLGVEHSAADDTPPDQSGDAK